MNQTLTLLESEPSLSDSEQSFGTLETDRGNLPLRRLEVEGHVTGLVYRACISQTFVNIHSVPLEATYIFPLPARAGVSRFRLKVQDRLLEGELQERGQARQTYDEALAVGHRAAIAEEERPEVFTLRAGNIPPGEAVAVELEMAGPLGFADGEATFRFPLVVAPRYIPGQPLDGDSVGLGTQADTDAVPDASRITPPVLLPGQPNPVHLTLRLEIDAAGLDFADFRCSLHQVRLRQLDEGRCRLELEPGAERVDRDFIVRFRVAGDRVSNGLAVDGQGRFALTVVPPGNSLPAPRDLVVLLDRSGSMEGWKMIAARRAAGRLIDSLTDTDRFGLVLFDNVVEEPAPSSGRLVFATNRARFRAVEFLARAEARGGTEIASALQCSLRYFQPEAKRERILVFITDGQVGNEDQLLRQVEKQAQGCRIFAIGIDRAVNAGLLERLSGYGGGCFELVESEERLDEVLVNVHRRIGAPILRDLKLNLSCAELTPSPADVFPGVPARLMGRIEGELPTQVEVTGVQGDGQSVRLAVPVSRTEDSALGILWARSRVLDLEHRFACQPDPALAQRITDFSLQTGVLCRFTAFVAVDRSQKINPGGKRHAVVQAVELPSGWAGQSPAQPQMVADRMFCRSAPPTLSAPSPSPLGFSPMALGAAPSAAPTLSPSPKTVSIGSLFGAPPKPKPKCKKDVGEEKSLAELLEQLKSLLQRTPFPRDLAEGILVRVLDLLERAGAAEQVSEGRALQNLLDVSRDQALAWIAGLEQSRPAERKSWWKR